MKVDSRAKLIRAVLSWALALVLIASVAFWYRTSERVPDNVTLVTGIEGGLYHQFALELQKSYERRTGRQMTVMSSAGSAANRRSILDGTAQLAIIQAGSVSLDQVELLSALYPEVVHVLVRKDLGIHSLEGLDGRKVVLGPLESGMRRSALEILEFHSLMPRLVEATNRYFGDLASDETLDAAVVTTGIFNPDLVSLLEGAQFRLLPIPAAGAVEARNAHLYEYELPLGVYSIANQVPPEGLATLATTALLVGHEGLAPTLIQDLLESVYEGGLHYRFPTLFRKDEVLAHSPGGLAKEADLFFNPADRIGQVANIMESIAAFKELAFAFFAGCYLLWGRLRRAEEREKARLIQREKDHLDDLLTETLRIEEAQVRESDPAALHRMLDEVTRIKLKALRQLTHEDLRGDRVFLIFLTQCANLISKIQAKLNEVAYQDQARLEE